MASNSLPPRLGRPDPDVSAPNIRQIVDPVEQWDWDPTGESVCRFDAVESGQEIVLPAGTKDDPAIYQIPRGVACERSGIHDLRVRSEGDAPPEAIWFVPENRESTYLWKFIGGERIDLSGYTLDYGGTHSGSIGQWLALDRDLHVHDIRKIGHTNPTATTVDGRDVSDRWFLFTHLTDPDGEGVIENADYTGSATITGHAQSRGYCGSFERHRGTLYWRDCYIENNPGDGPYTGTSGTHRWEGCQILNGAMAGIRCGGSDSWIRECEITIAPDRQPEQNDGRYESFNAIYWDPQRRNSGRGRITNNSIYLSDSGAGDPDTPGASVPAELPGYGIVLDSSAGGVVIDRNTIACHADSVPAIFAHAPGKRWDGYPPDGDWSVTVARNDIYGQATYRLPAGANRSAGRHAPIVLERRPESRVFQCAFALPNAEYIFAALPWTDEQCSATVSDLCLLEGSGTSGVADDPAGKVTVLHESFFTDLVAFTSRWGVIGVGDDFDDGIPETPDAPETPSDPTPAPDPAPDPAPAPDTPPVETVVECVRSVEFEYTTDGTVCAVVIDGTRYVPQMGAKD